MKSMQKDALWHKKFTHANWGALVLFLCFSVQVLAQVAGQVPLAPASIPQFVDPLPHFAGQRLNAKAGGSMTVTMKPTQQIAVSTGTVLAGGVVTRGGNIGKANLWAYELQYGATTKPAFWPAFTIDAQRGNALNVSYVNALAGQTYANLGLIVDETLHWAMPAGFNGSNPPAVVHLHGGEVPPLSDGGPDAWFTPGNLQTGHAFNPNPYFYPNTQEAATLWFHDHALGVTRLNVYAGMAGFYFLRGPEEEAARLPGWSGDDLVREATGGFQTAPYLPEIEIAIQDRMFDTNGQLYFPSVGINPEHPYWVPEFIGNVITVNGKTWPYLSVAPRKYRFRILNGSNARFYELWLENSANGTPGPIIYQVGTDGGLLNAPVTIDPSRGGKLILGPGERADVVINFSAKPGAVWTLRNSGRTPYPKGGPPNGSTDGRIMRFVVNGKMVSASNPANAGTDKSKLPATLRTPLVQLTNNWTAAPNPVLPGPIKVRQLTLNEVMGAGGPMEVLVNNTKWAGHSVAHDIFAHGVRPDFTPVTNGDGSITYYSETTDEGRTEIWKIINLTADAHPIHLHLVQFQLLSRQNFNVSNYNKAYNALFPASTAIDPMTGLPYPGGVFIGGYGPPKPYDFYFNATTNTGWLGGNPDITPYLQDGAKPANSNERGWKDTFIMYPGQVTTVIARWAPTDKAANLDPAVPANAMWFPFNPNGGHGYVWHCHIIDHEDNEMMRPYNVTPNPFGPWAPPALAKHGASHESSATAAGINTFELDQNFPNPFNPSTSITFSLPVAGEVKLAIYNIRGELIHHLIDGRLESGVHRIVWNGADANGNRVASGVYFYRLAANGLVSQKKLILAK